MDELHIKNWKSNNKIKKILTNLPNFNNYFSPSDISRINSNIDFTLSQIQQLYNFYDKLNEKIISEHIDISESDIENNLGGGFYFENKLYILCYCELNIGIPIDTTWSFNIPLIGKFSKTNENDITILIPLENAKYIFLNSIEEIVNNGIFIFPGKIHMKSNNKLILGFYETLDFETVSQKYNNEDYIIKSNNNTNDILQYLIDFHTRKVQTGYFAPIQTSLKQSFNDYGMNFYVDNPNSSSYYERLPPLKLDDVLHLPFENIEKDIFISLYIRKNDISVDNHIPASLNIDSEFNFPVDVNIRLIDLNFIWSIQNLESDSSIENKIVKNKNTFYSKHLKQIPNNRIGKFYLSETDKKCLAYFTHSPNMIFILGFNKQYKDGKIF